jgi:hypothetical protein
MIYLHCKIKRKREEKKMELKRIFTQKHISHDCEARDWEWVNTKSTYEDIKNYIKSEWNAWINGVRVVEKTFNDETFEITTEVLKIAMRAYENYSWAEGKIDEKIYRE